MGDSNRVKDQDEKKEVVRITLNVTPEYARLLQDAVDSGHFDEFPIIKAGILDANGSQESQWRMKESERQVAAKDDNPGSRSGSR